MSGQNYQQQQYQYQPQQPYYYPQHPTSYQYLPPTQVPPAHYQQSQYYNYNYYQQQQQHHPPAVSYDYYNYSNYHQEQPQTPETNRSKSRNSEKENKPKIDKSKLNHSNQSKFKVKSVLPEKPLSLQIKSLNTSYTSSDEKIKYSPVYSPETIKQFVSSMGNDLNDSKPSTNSSSQPSTNSSSQPSTTSASQPNSTASETQPSTNSSSQPSTNSASQPSTNSSSQPSTNSASLPSTNSASQPSTNSASQPNSTILQQANLTASETQPSTNLPTENRPLTNLSSDSQSQFFCSCCGNCMPGKTFIHRKECKKPGCKCIITCNCTCDCPPPIIPSNNICRCKGVPNACEPYKSPKLDQIDLLKNTPINQPEGTESIILTKEINKHNMTEDEKKIFPEEYKKLDAFKDLFKDPNVLFEDLKVIKMNEEEEKAFTDSGRDITKHKIREGPIYTETRTFENKQKISIHYLEPENEADKIILKEQPHKPIAAPPLIVRIPAKKADLKISKY
jgi:hypothetical protein